jgi:hypothetical protein
MVKREFMRLLPVAEGEEKCIGKYTIVDSQQSAVAH